MEDGGTRYPSGFRTKPGTATHLDRIKHYWTCLTLRGSGHGGSAQPAAPPPLPQRPPVFLWRVVIQ